MTVRAGYNSPQSGGWPPKLLDALRKLVVVCRLKPVCEGGKDCACCYLYDGPLSVAWGGWTSLSARGVLIGKIGTMSMCKNRRCVRPGHHYAGRVYDPQRDTVLGARLKELFDSEAGYQDYL